MFWSEGVCNSDGAVERSDRNDFDRDQQVVEAEDLQPVGGVDGIGPIVYGGDLRVEVGRGRAGRGQVLLRPVLPLRPSGHDSRGNGSVRPEDHRCGGETADGS